MNCIYGMKLMHNAMLLCKAEQTINNFLENGMIIYLKNLTVRESNYRKESN